MHIKRYVMALLLLAVSGPAYSQDTIKVARAQAHKPGDRIILRGCVEQGTPEFCRKLSGYNVTAAYPTLQVGQLVQLAGTITTFVSPCPGTVLTDITYTAFPAFCSRRK
jgi:hypothetical protein